MSLLRLLSQESTAEREYEAEKARREELRADDSKAGRANSSRWHSERAKCHLNIKAGPEGLSVLRLPTRRSYLCHLHVARLNLPKTPWKWGLLNHMSDEGRERAQIKLKGYMRVSPRFGGEAEWPRRFAEVLQRRVVGRLLQRR